MRFYAEKDKGQDNQIWISITNSTKYFIMLHLH